MNSKNDKNVTKNKKINGDKNLRTGDLTFLDKEEPKRGTLTPIWSSVTSPDFFIFAAPARHTKKGQIGSETAGWVHTREYRSRRGGEVCSPTSSSKAAAAATATQRRSRGFAMGKREIRRSRAEA
jgi:hypothetical protein